jgi:hypothetical protein
MRFVLLHYHILKNAGTTVERILGRNFGAGFATLDSPDPNAHVANAALLSFLDRNPHIKAVSSHQTHYPRPDAPDAIFFDLCFLRDPIDRIRSMYSDFRRRPPTDDPVCSLARESGPGEFARQLVEKHPHLVNDAQVVLLANRGAYDHPPGRKDLDRAIDTILKMSFVGVVDMFNESWVAGQYFLSPVFPILDCAAVPANVSSADGGGLAERIGRFRAACGARVYAQLRDLNALDAELVQRTRSEVRRRFTLAPDHKERLRALQERVMALTGTQRPQPAGIVQPLVRWARTVFPHHHFPGA